jgi:hypothetical protein
VALPAGPAPATNTSTSCGNSVKPPPDHPRRTTGKRSGHEVHSIVGQPGPSCFPLRWIPAPMHSPFTGLIAVGTIKAALEGAAHGGIHQHSEETYQRSDRQEHRHAGRDGSGAGNQGSSYHRSGGTGQSDAAAGTRRHLPPGPQQPGRNPTVGSNGSGPGIGCGSGEACGHQPDLEAEIGTCHDGCQRCGSAIGVHLPGISPVPFGIHPRVVGPWCQPGDQIAAHKKRGQNRAAFPSRAMKDEQPYSPCRRCA